LKETKRSVESCFRRNPKYTNHQFQKRRNGERPTTQRTILNQSHETPKPLHEPIERSPYLDDKRPHE
jgi:hypothetical protein